MSANRGFTILHFSSPGSHFWRFVAAAVLGLIAFAYASSLPKRDLGDFALGRETTSRFGSINDERVHCRNPDTAHQCLGPMVSRDLARAALWLGNSQLHAINQYEEGDQTAPVMMAQELRNQGIDLVTFSLPNASLTEHYVLYEWIAQRQEIDTLILPIVFDDTREMGVRDALSVVFEDGQFRDQLDLAGLGLDVGDFADETSSEDAAPQLMRDVSEQAINDALEETTGFNTGQLAVRGRLAINMFYLRNTVLGINPSTVRPMIPEGYRTNMAALERILRQAQSRGTRVLLYVAPLRSDVPQPHNPREYRQFIADSGELADRYGAEFSDMTELVPGELYGMKDATRFFAGPEYDFMHFRTEGHRILADQLRPMVVGEAQ